MLMFCESLNLSCICVSSVSPLWSVPVCELCRASVGASLRGHLVELQLAPPLFHQNGAV